MSASPPSRRPGLLHSAAGLLRRVLVRRPRSARAPAPAYPGDFTGRLDPAYEPKGDSRPDPGEVVWTWVPFEEDHRQGKDRPVLIVGRDGQWLLGLQLSSRDHDGRRAGDGRLWVDVGPGDWDRQRRPSEVRVDRVVRVDPARIRREGAVLSPAAFSAVADAVARLNR